MSGVSQDALEESNDAGSQTNEDQGNSKNNLTLNKSRPKHRGCKCRGDCRNLRCGCNARQYECSDSCGCSNLTCKNRKDCLATMKDDATELNSDESFTEDNENDKENKHYTFIKHDADELDNNNTQAPSNVLLTPHLIRRSAIKFDTNSATKKFFH